GPPATPSLLNKIMPYLFSTSQWSVRVRPTMAIVADTEAPAICAPSLPRHRHPVTPRCDSDYAEPPHHAERPRRSRGTLAGPPLSAAPLTCSMARRCTSLR